MIVVDGATHFQKDGVENNRGSLKSGAEVFVLFCLWLAETYVILAGMYCSQVWGTGFLQAGREFSSSLSTSFAFSERHIRC